MRQTATRKYDITARLTFSVDQNGLPVLFTSTVPDNAEKSFTPYTAFSPLNSAYLTPEGKIDKQKLFAYILPEGKRMSTLQLRQVIMKVMNIKAFNFAGSVILQADNDHIIHKITVNDTDFYELVQGQETIF